MQGGSVSLRPLYYFVKRDLCAESLKGRSSIGRRYGKEIDRIVLELPNEQGLYLWGRYEKSGRWINIYLGKAGFGKTSDLRAMIREELKDERCCMWRSIMNQEDILQRLPDLYPHTCDKYRVQWERAMGKAGSSHIVWVSDPELSNENVEEIESDLIETLNPTANQQHRVPPTSLQRHTQEIVGLLRKEIHSCRDKRYMVNLV